MRRFRSVLLPILALLASAPAAAQNFPATLQNEIKSAKESMMADPAETLRHVEQVDKLARALPGERERTLGLATARWLGAEANLRSNAPERAEPLLIQGLKLVGTVQGPTKLRGDLLMSQGTLFMQRDQAVQALSNYQAAFGIYGEVKEPRSQAIALQTIGTLYNAANDGERAEQYYRQAAEAYDDDPVLSFTLHNNRGNVLSTLERHSEAEKEYQAALAVARALKKPLLEARILVNLARNQIDLERYDAASASVARAFELIRGADAEMLRRTLLATAARLASDQGNQSRAVQLI
ncbi:MAG: tetratricopeptide repeat protein, partial [Sphingomonadales bacterium]